MPIKHYTSLSLVVLVMIAALPQGSSADLCAGADYKTLCRSVVGRAKTPYAAAEATVKRLISETKKANLSAARLPKKDYSQTCATLYNDAISDLETSLKDLRSRDIGSFNVRLSAVRSNCETCKDAFAEMGKQFPLAAQNTLIQQLASTGLYISTLIN